MSIKYQNPVDVFLFVLEQVCKDSGYPYTIIDYEGIEKVRQQLESESESELKKIEDNEKKS